MTGLAVSDDKFWVNLAPWEPDRIIDEQLGQSDVGRIMLEADFQMKKDFSNYMNPCANETGKAQWNLLDKKRRALVQKCMEKFPGEIKDIDNVWFRAVTAHWIVPDITNEDVAFLQYTGGTTGVSKGAMLTHRTNLANMEQISVWMSPKLTEGEETVVTALPMYHIFALTVNCLAMLKYGARNILITNPRDMPAFIKTLKKFPFTILTGVNTLFNGLLNQEEFKNVDFSKFKIAVGGAWQFRTLLPSNGKKLPRSH